MRAGRSKTVRINKLFSIKVYLCGTHTHIHTHPYIHAYMTMELRKIQSDIIEESDRFFHIALFAGKTEMSMKSNDRSPWND